MPLYAAWKFTELAAALGDVSYLWKVDPATLFLLLFGTKGEDCSVNSWHLSFSFILQRQLHVSHNFYTEDIYIWELIFYMCHDQDYKQWLAWLLVTSKNRFQAGKCYQIRGELILFFQATKEPQISNSSMCGQVDKQKCFWASNSMLSLI